MAKRAYAEGLFSDEEIKSIIRPRVSHKNCKTYSRVMIFLRSKRTTIDDFRECWGEK